tara:strand:- start:4596 stop:5294 length:699 start_codon:yes stop_codon:yes gene_type:complete
MPTIVFANPKGGAGKTTAAFLLATELAARGKAVNIIDADPNRPMAEWEAHGGKQDNLTITVNADEETILENINDAAEEADFVIVDLEGTANLSVAYAVSLADLVIVPAQRSQLDAKEAAKAVALVKRQEKVTGRNIPVSILLTKTSPAIRSKGIKRMTENMKKKSIDTFMIEIHEREAFKAVFDYSCTLNQLTSKQVSLAGLKTAKENAADYAAEVVRKLKAFKSAQEEKVA